MRKSKNGFIIENKDFLTLEYKQQKAIVDKYAEEKLKEMMPSEKVKRTLTDLEAGEDATT